MTYTVNFFVILPLTLIFCGLPKESWYRDMYRAQVFLQGLVFGFEAVLVEGTHRKGSERRAAAQSILCHRGFGVT